MKPVGNRPGVLLLLAMLACLLIASPISAEEEAPGAAPVWPAPDQLRAFTEPWAVAEPVDCSQASCLYLPWIQTAGRFLNTLDRGEVLDAYRQRYVVSPPINPEWTGSHDACAPGGVSQALTDAILGRVNYFRAMAGVPSSVTFDPEFSRKSQAAALMLSVNRQLSLPTPQWKCYSADGAEAFNNANLSLGGFGVDAIKGQMRDAGAGNYAVGHRRWILYPQTRQMGTGNVPAAGSYTYGAALWVFDANLRGPRPTTRDGFVSWPPPGYVPYGVVFARWSFSYPGADFGQATISMTEDGGSVPIAVAPLNVDYGENTIVWIRSGMTDNANWPKPDHDTVYTVTVAGVRLGAVTRSFSYQVTIFDPDI